MAITQQGVQAVTALLGHDLPGVGRADRVDHRGVVEAASHEVHLARPFLDQLGRTHAQEVEHAQVPAALVHQVVDGVDRRHAGIAAVHLAGGGQPGDGQGRVPVVAVNHVGTPTHRRNGQVQRCPAKEGETQRIVGVAVNLGLVAKAVLLGDEPDRHRAGTQARSASAGTGESRRWRFRACVAGLSPGRRPGPGRRRSAPGASGAMRGCRTCPRAGRPRSGRRPASPRGRRDPGRPAPWAASHTRRPVRLPWRTAQLRR